MKNFEKYTLFILCFVLIFIIFPIKITILLEIFIVVFAILKKQYLYIVFSLILLFVGSYRGFSGEIKTGEVYKTNLYIDKNIEIKSLNNKLLKNKVYLKNSLIENNIGFFEASIKIEKVQEFHNIIYLEGEILQFKENYFNKYRTKIEKIIERTGYSFALESFVKAIVLGERGNLSQELEENYRKVGATHILSISGLHISIIIIAFLALFHYFGFNYRLKYSLTLVLLSSYVLILGNNPAVIRSYIMGFIFLLSKIFFEKADIKKSFCLSMGICLVINPFVIKDLSFIMSYSAIFSIVYIYEKYKKENVYYNALLVSILVQLVLSPVTVYYFKTLAIYSFIFNLFIIIWGDLLINLIFIGVFLESIKLGFLVRFLVEFFYQVLDSFIEFCTKFPFSSFSINREISLWYFSLMIITVIFLLKDKKITVYLMMITVVLYNFLPYENKINKDFIYLPKNKTLVLLNEKTDFGIKEYFQEAKMIVCMENIEGLAGNKIVLKLSKGEEIDIEKFKFRNVGKKLTY